MKKRYPIVLLLLWPIIGWSEDLPSFEVPEFMKAEVVANRMKLNGMEMKTYTFTSEKPIADIEAFYEDLWRDRVKQTKVKPWNIISHPDQHYLYVVQINDNDKTPVTGFLSISDLESLQADFVRGEGFSMPPSSNVINDITSNDYGKESRTLVIENDNSVAENLRFFRRNLSGAGWRELSDTLKSDVQKIEGPALVMNKGEDEMNIAITSAGGKTMIVAVEVNK